MSQVPRVQRAAAVKMAKRGRGLREDEMEETTQTSEMLSAAATQTASQPPIVLQGETDALRSGFHLLLFARLSACRPVAVGPLAKEAVQATLPSIHCDSRRILTPPVLLFFCLVDPFLSLTRAAF